MCIKDNGRKRKAQTNSKRRHMRCAEMHAQTRLCNSNCWKKSNIRNDTRPRKTHIWKLAKMKQKEIILKNRFALKICKPQRTPRENVTHSIFYKHLRIPNEFGRSEIKNADEIRIDHTFNGSVEMRSTKVPSMANKLLFSLKTVSALLFALRLR